MTRDVYAWIDPFEEIARLEREARHAHQAAVDKVLIPLERISREMLETQLRRHVDALARRVAVEIVLPIVQRNRDMISHEVLLREAEISVATYTTPAVGLLTHEGHLTLASLAPGSDPGLSFKVQYEVIHPCRYAIKMDLDPRERP